MGFSVKEIQGLEHGKLPDPIADAIRAVMKDQEKLAERIKRLESKKGISIDNYQIKKGGVNEGHLRATEEFNEGGGI
jgi:serine O-acetyltransferase